MHWLAPEIALYAAAAAVPALLFLYFLKLRRHEHPVPSTLLWRRAVQDLQVNAPIQRLRVNILLILQLLALAAMLCALGQPVLDLDTGSARRYVILIDRSASMATKEGPDTRLDLAKKQARDFVQTLRSARFNLADATQDQAMVVAFDRSAKVVCRFTADKRELERAIDSITQGDSLSSLSEAMLVAKASSQPPGLEDGNRSAMQAQLELFSDGRIPDAEGLSMPAGTMKFHKIGKTADNVAITAMQARRSYEKPEEVSVFAVLANYNQAQVEANVQLSIDGNVRSIRAVQVPPLRPAMGAKPAAPGTMSVTFNLTHNAAGVIEVRQLRKDALATDDSAWATLGAPRRLSVLLATDGNFMLKSALEACPLAKLDVKTAAELSKLSAAAVAENGELPYNVVVIDNCAPARLPRGRYIIFGQAPACTGAKVGADVGVQEVQDWRSRHSVLQSVNLMSMYTQHAWKLTLPRDAEVLADFRDAPALVLMRREGSQFLLANLDLATSDWWYNPSFVMFFYNATGYLGTEIEQSQETMIAVGLPITMTGLAPGSRGKIAGPGVDSRELTADPSGAMRFAGTDRAGLYVLTPAGKPPAPFAANLLDEKESFIEPAQYVDLMGQSVQAVDEGKRMGNLELWPFLAALALALVCVEWLVYNKKAKI